MRTDISDLLEGTTPQDVTEPDLDALIRRGRTRRIRDRSAVALVVGAVLAAGAVFASGLGTDRVPVVDSMPAGHGHWEALPDSPLSARQDPVTLATDDGRAVVWSGQPQHEHGGPGARLTDGAVYDPATSSWAPIPPAPIDPPQHQRMAAFADDRLAVFTQGVQGPAVAAIYDLNADRWVVPEPPPVDSRSPAAFVFDGRRLLVWGGWDADETYFADGAIYDLERDTWTVIPDAPTGPRVAPSTAWTGDELIVWGGYTGSIEDGTQQLHADGAIYDPNTGTWTVVADSPLSPRSSAAALWTGRHLIVHGGDGPTTLKPQPTQAPSITTETATRCDQDGTCMTTKSGTITGTSRYDYTSYTDGARYDPNTDTWTPISTPPFEDGHSYTLDRLLLHANIDDRLAVYQPATDTWQTHTFDAGTLRDMEIAQTGGRLLLHTEARSVPLPDEEFYALTPRAAGGWRRTATAPFQRRQLPAIAYLPDGLFVWGGADPIPSHDGRGTSELQLRADGWLLHFDP